MTSTKSSRREFLKTTALTPIVAGVASNPIGNALLAQDAATADPQSAPTFQVAQPVWAEGREEEMNVSLVFVAPFVVESDEAAKGAILRVTGSSILRVGGGFISGDEVPEDVELPLAPNLTPGTLFGYGPARGPHGWFRVDEWDISSRVKKGLNVVYVEISGYNSNSFDILDQPSFLQAEIVDGNGKVLAATLPEGEKCAPMMQIFTAYDATGIRVQKVQRFSFQRPFIEVYDYRGVKIDMEATSRVKLAKQPEVKYLPRRVPYPEFAIFEPVGYGKRCVMSHIENFENPWRDRSLVNIGPELKGYKMEELSLVLSDDIQQLLTTFVDDEPLKEGATYHAADAQIFDFGANLCGFFGLEVETEGETEIAITFDEILNPLEELYFLRLGSCAAAKWTFNSDRLHRFECIEPQVGRYLKLFCLKGSFKLKRLYLREYAYPPTREASFDCSDPRLKKIYNAAQLTFRENSVDVFTDCPHRERAGWLCDSFFTSRVAFDLTGKTDVETAFLENYMLPESFKCLPDGMLPMCYPSDHYDGVYIPNWAMWFVMELGEFATRSADRTIVKGLRRKIEKLLAFLAKYENSDGLLEKLPSWVFVEWSDANKFVQDVNYPSNMTYAAVLETAGRLYDVPEWTEKGKKVRETICKQSFNGKFFLDHAVRQEDGTLKVLDDCSEVCQYFAFFFKTATPETYPELYATLIDKFGPHRAEQGLFPEVAKANAFVGNVLRLEIVASANRGDQLLDESVAYNEYMADRTGTLWENDLDYASCNHGFASHTARVFYRDILGIKSVDVAARKIEIRLSKIDTLEWASGVQPLGGDAIKLRWEKKDGKLLYSLETPSGYDVAFHNDSGLEAVKTTK